MAKVSYVSPQVNAAVTYNWSTFTPLIGDLSLCTVSLDAPGVGPGSGINTITTSIAPRPIFQPVLGQIVAGWEPTLGYGEFIYLAVPVSTAVPLGTLVTWFTSTLANYTVAACPTTAKSAAPVAVCVSNTSGTTGGITSNANSIQYAWFQLVGIVQTLKTAVIHTLNSKVFVSGTAGRVMVTSASGTNIIGARFASSNSATISMALVWYDRANVMGNIT
jgi:hypothetical protein